MHHFQASKVRHGSGFEACGCTIRFHAARLYSWISPPRIATRYVAWSDGACEHQRWLLGVGRLVVEPAMRAVAVVVLDEDAQPLDDQRHSDGEARSAKPSKISDGDSAVRELRPARFTRRPPQSR